MNSKQFFAASENYEKDHGKALFDLLRNKWHTVPADLSHRIETLALLSHTNLEISNLWTYIHDKSTQNDAYETRGWYQEIYKDIFKGKKILEIGSGFGIDGIFFAENGAQWHFCDISESNLKVIEKILRHKNLQGCGFTYIESLASFAPLKQDYDFIYCHGAFVNTPTEFAEFATQIILQRLKSGGRWIEQCIAKEKWIREGQLAPEQEGNVTDETSSPWVEWYDLERFKQRFSPIRITPIFAFNFMNDNYKWFDVKISNIPKDLLQKGPSLFRQYHQPFNFLNAGIYVQDNTKIQKVDNPYSHKVILCETPKEQWNYAYHFPIRFNEEFPDVELSDHELTLKVRIHVHKGFIGVGLVAENLRDYQTTERVLSASNTATEVSISAPKNPSQSNLVFRQTSDNGESSVFELNSISFHLEPLCLAEKPTGFPTAPIINLTDLVKTNTHTSDHDQVLVDIPILIEAVDVADLTDIFPRKESKNFRLNDSTHCLEWKMETNDAPILEYIYRAVQPKRHLEFGTWQGFGAKLCAESCNATIWTINLPEGEKNRQGVPVYASGGMDERNRLNGEATQTDSGEMIGHLYRNAGYEHRIHQILVDSNQWDTSEFTDGFFDTVLIDGGHDPKTVENDTNNALRLVRSGGLILWHDFCPAEPSLTNMASTQGVVSAIYKNWHKWSACLERVFWINPSYLLVGIKRDSST